MTRKAAVFIVLSCFAAAVSHAADSDPDLAVVVKGSELKPEVKEQLAKNLTSAEEFRQMPLMLSARTLRPDLEKQLQNVLPAIAPDGRPYHYKPVCLTLPEFEALAKNGLSRQDLRGLLRRSPDAAAALYEQSAAIDERFLPVIVQVRGQDDLTALAVFNKNGTVSNTLFPDPGGATGGLVVGTPILRLTDPSSVVIDPLRPDLSAAAAGRFATAEDTAVTRYRIAEGRIEIRPLTGTQEPVILEPGKNDIAFVRLADTDRTFAVEKGLVEVQAIALEEAYRTAVVAIEGSVSVRSDTFIGEITLDSEGNNFFGQTAGGRNVFESDPALSDRDENSEPLVEEAKEILEEGDASGGGTAVVESPDDPPLDQSAPEEKKDPDEP